MNRVLHVAMREFLATVLTRGFLIGLLVLPLVILVMATLFPKLIKSAEKAPRVVGEVAVVDPTGEITTALTAYLSPEAIAERRGDLLQKADEAVPDAVKEIGGGEVADRQRDAMELVLGKVPQLDVVDLGPAADIERAKEPLRDFRMEKADAGGRLALVVVDADAVRPAAGEQDYGSYELYVAEKIDDRIEDEIRDGLRESIVDARVAAAGLDRGDIERLTRVKREAAVAIGAEGEKTTSKKEQVARMLIPVAFMILLMMSVLISGQQLMTNTIEEKSSRVIELLLSAVSPMELMTGKILGQLGVGVLILVLYGGVGIVGLIVSSLFGLIEISLLFYAMLFFLVAYFMLASGMAAIGSAVNEVREAQSLMTPVMLTIMIPYMLWLPISRDPNSTFATVLSFVPPINPFVMMLRLTSSTPPPIWQVWLSILIGVAGVYAAIWFAAKVFRIGILMYGKPPNFKTLVRWVRMA